MRNELGPDVTAWICEYESGEVFASLAHNPMNNQNVRKAWRLLTIAQRDEQVAAAVAAERERCARTAETCDLGPIGPSVPEQRRRIALAIRDA